MLRVRKSFVMGLAFMPLLLGVPVWAQESPANVRSASQLPPTQKLQGAVIDTSGALAAACSKDELNTETVAVQISSFLFTRLSRDGLRAEEMKFTKDEALRIKRAVRQALAVPESKESLAGTYTLCQLRLAARAVAQELWSGRSPIGAQVIIPKQDITDERLEFQIIVGNMELPRVSFACEKALQKCEPTRAGDALKHRALDVAMALLADKVGLPVTVEEVERVALLVGEVTDTTVKANIEPGAELLGTGLDFQITPNIRNYSLGLQFDNLGSRYTGVFQATTSFKYDGALSIGDRTSGSYTGSESGSAFNSYTLTYDRPLGNRGLRAGIYLASTDYAIAGTFSALGSTGNADVNGIYLNSPIKRQSDLRSELSIGYNKVKLSDNTIVTSSNRSLQILWADFRGLAIDDSGSYSWGIGGTLGQWSSASAAFTNLAPKSNAGSYNILNIDFKRQQNLSPTWDATLSGKGQVASTNLDNYHKFALAGIRGVRAFPVGEISGDEGYILRTDIGYRLNSERHTSRVSAFYDFGRVRINNSPLSSGINVVNIAGAGVQLETVFARNMTLTAFWAKPLGGDRTASVADNGGSRLGAVFRLTH